MHKQPLIKNAMAQSDYIAVAADGQPQEETAAAVGRLGLLAMLGSAFLFSIMAVIVKCLSRFGPFQLVFWRSVFMFCGTATMLRVGHQDLWGKPSDRPILIARGVAGFGFMGTFYYAIKVLPLSDAVVITYTSPVITGVAAAVLLREPWGRLDALGSMLCLMGVLLISKPSFVMNGLGLSHATPPPLAGVLGALTAALLSTMVYLLLRRAKHLSPVVSTSYFALIGAILSPLFGFAQGELFLWPRGIEWLQLVLLAGLSVAGQILMNVGLARESAGKATAMNYVQVVFAYAFQIVIFHQPTDAMSTLGALMIASWGCIALVKEGGCCEPGEEPHVAVAHAEDLHRPSLLPRRHSTALLLHTEPAAGSDDAPRRTQTMPGRVGAPGAARS
mmetsp:Transcript_4313/g.11646  ORF Transcript_4313/g.11646 Transcript_4313/m.11646 type:complete len:389 (-) Transcript_4313:224-1390(-)